MGGTPDTHHRNGNKRGEMRVGAVHGNHHIKMAHDNEFLMKTLGMLVYRQAAA